MATQSYIFERENKIIEIRKVIEELNKVLQYETHFNAGVCHKENTDVWGTVGVNLSVLATQANKLYQRIQEARRLAESRSPGNRK